MVAGEEKSEWKSYWKKISTLFLAAVSVILCVLYSLNVISLYWLIREFIAALGAVFFLYVIQYVKFEKLSEKGRLTGNKVAYVVGGSSLRHFHIFRHRRYTEDHRLTSIILHYWFMANNHPPPSSIAMFRRILRILDRQKKRFPTTKNPLTKLKEKHTIGENCAV